MLVQLNKCVVVCGSHLQRGHSGYRCLSSLILFKYECSMGHCLFWVGPGYDGFLGGSVVSECCTVSGMVFVTLLCCRLLMYVLTMLV